MLLIDLLFILLIFSVAQSSTYETRELDTKHCLVLCKRQGRALSKLEEYGL